MAIVSSRLPARAAPRRGFRLALKNFYWKAYEDNLTGLSAMVAYNLLLSVFPLALLALFIAGKILGSQELENSVLKDLQHLFPSTAEHTLADANVLALIGGARHAGAAPPARAADA